MTKHLLPALSVLLLSPLLVRAHDYWLQADTFFPAVGAPVPVRLHVGEGLLSEKERPFQKKPTLAFRLLSARAPVNLAARAKEGDTPVARVTFPAAGTYLLAMERAPQRIEMEAKKFNAYLAEEGLDAALAQRRKLGEDKLPGRERYSRYLKALVQVGKGDDVWKRAVGQRLEIVPLLDPFSVKKGGKLPVRILFDGKPLAGAKVFAHRRAGGKTATQSGVTSAKGEVTFELDGTGTWLVRLVHLRRATRDKGADWESFWGALTFATR